MTRKQSVRYEMLARVRNFGEANKEVFIDSPAALTAFAAVGEAAGHLARHAVLKVAAAQEGKRRKQQARKEVSDRLRTIMRTARLLARTNPNIDDPFRLPAHRSNRTLIAAGRGFLEYAAPVAAQFVEHGLPATFLPDLKGAVDTLEAAITDVDSKRKDRSAAKNTITTALSAGMAAVHTLDVIVANRLQSDPVAMAAWERERRIDPVKRPRTVPVAPVTTTPAPATATEAASPVPDPAPTVDPGSVDATKAA